MWSASRICDRSINVANSSLQKCNSLGNCRQNFWQKWCGYSGFTMYERSQCYNHDTNFFVTILLQQDATFGTSVTNTVVTNTIRTLNFVKIKAVKSLLLEFEYQPASDPMSTVHFLLEHSDHPDFRCRPVVPTILHI